MRNVITWTVTRVWNGYFWNILGQWRIQKMADQRCQCLTIRQNLQIKGIFISKFCVADLQVNMKLCTSFGHSFLWQFTNMCLLPNLKISIWFWTVTAHLKMQIRRYFGKGIHKILNCLGTPITLGFIFSLIIDHT